jgi:hypothetical protein
VECFATGEKKVRAPRLSSVAGLSIDESTEAAPSSSADLEVLRSGFRDEIAAASEPLRSEFEMLKAWTVASPPRKLESRLPGTFRRSLKIAGNRNLLFCGGAAALCDFGCKPEHLRRLHSCGVGVIEKGKRKRDPDEPFAKVDASQKSFPFALKNPHNVPVRRFALKDEEIWCDSQRGPDLVG